MGMGKRAKPVKKTTSPRVKSRPASRQAYVYVVCGNEHAERVNTSLEFLKKFSRKEIVILGSGISAPINHDQLIDVPRLEGFDDHQMAIMIKTGLPRYLKDPGLTVCYLDNDVIAVNRDVDSIFTRVKGPFAFAPDHYPLPTFSRYAVNCGCAESQCAHLAAAIQKKFKVTVKDLAWAHWNGGVFVYKKEAKPLWDLWNRYTREIFNDPYWKTRDQGTLVAAAWKLGLQKTPTLPREYNFIVDCWEGTPLKNRQTLQGKQIPFNDTYSLKPHKTKPTPKFIHFINGGVKRKGWKNWEEAEALLMEGQPVAGKKAGKANQKGRLGPSNRVVHGLWIGNRLSKLEQLTIRSFIKHGHEFHLWLYDDLETPLPPEVILEDAGEIISRDKIFRKKDIDPETGVGRGSVGAPFSDLFRYKLLYEKGGYWVDMDVTCLKPLNFPGDYVFRPHRVGVVGNIMKCPPKSALMRMTYEQVLMDADEKSPWLMPNRVLSRNVRKFKLDRYILPGICNEDKWEKIILPFIEREAPIPEGWHAIHWINEMWRTLEMDKGMYRGVQCVEEAPNKDSVPSDSTLGHLYEEYGLAGEPAQAAEENTAPAPPSQVPPMPVQIETSAVRQPVTPEISQPIHINLMLPSLARGGAERSVVETLQGLSKHQATSKLFVLADTQPCYEYKGDAQRRVYRLHSLDLETKMRMAAFEILASPTPVVFTHMIHLPYLRALWRYGVHTIPVIQNSRPSWQNDPVEFDDPHVPFVAAVSEDVAGQLRAAKCPKPVVAVRHELQRWFSPGELQEMRRKTRDHHSVPENTLLIGMVGEFKTQKAYTRAVRVLAEIRRHQKAKLMILGGWDHQWGNGRLAYEATCRQALELGVMPDLLTPGPVKDVAPYYAAFDVFLNTSVYEGLSVATLEAIQAGCPIVSADAGGNRECLPPESALVRETADIGAYVRGIAQVLSRGQRLVPVPPADTDLVPRLWCALGQYGVPALYPDSQENLPRSREDAKKTLLIDKTKNQKKDGILFLTDNLNLGGSPRSLVNLLSRLPLEGRTWLGVIQSINHQPFLDELDSAGVPVFSMRPARGYLNRVEQILAMIRHLGIGTVVFWNVEAKVKLLLSKILPPDQVRLVDVSPGPWLFTDIQNQVGFQQRIAWGAQDYFRRLDHFVSKYEGGHPPGMRMAASKLTVIPNGVPDLSAVPDAGKGDKPERGWIIGTCCRILPSKRIEYLLEMLSELNKRLPGGKMILVGAGNPKYEDYWRFIQKRMRELGVANIQFAGHQGDVRPFLRRFQVFVLLGTDHGSPNASLEAMSLGLPIVSTKHGGIKDQVEPGVNGYLVSDSEPREMAHQVRLLLMNPSKRERFGKAGRRIVNEKFTMDLMVQRYCGVLGLKKNDYRSRKNI
jgi:glycosyltransferase involved in cell wall biosynthesis